MDTRSDALPDGASAEMNSRLQSNHHGTTSPVPLQTGEQLPGSTEVSPIGSADRQPQAEHSQQQQEPHKQQTPFASPPSGPAAGFVLASEVPAGRASAVPSLEDSQLITEVGGVLLAVLLVFHVLLAGRISTYSAAPPFTDQRAAVFFLSFCLVAHRTFLQVCMHLLLGSRGQTGSSTLRLSNRVRCAVKESAWR
jgi:hypothetical protein